MENDTRNANGGRPVPPDGFSQKPAVSHHPTPSPVTHDRHEEEPFDVLGGVSLFMGILALFVIPVIQWAGIATPIAFSAFSIICGAIRLIDRRFYHRGDAAIAGMIASLITLAFSAGIFAVRLCDNPMLSNLLGCSSISQTSNLDALHDAHMGDMYNKEYGYDDDCDADCESDCADESLYDESNKVWHDDSDNDALMDLDEYGYPYDEYEDVSDELIDDAPDEDSNASEGEGHRLDVKIKQVPVHDGKSKPSQVPLAKPDDKSAKQADVA